MIRSVASGPVWLTRVSPDEGIKVMASTVCTKNKKGFDECASIMPQPCPLAQSATATVLIPDAHDDVDESVASSLPNGAVQMRMSRSAALSLFVSMCQSKIRSAASGPVRLTRVSPDEGIKVMASTVCKKNKKGFNECAFIVPQPCPLAQSATATVLILDAHDDVDESGTSSLPNDAVQMRMSRSAALSLFVSMCQSKIRSAASGPVRLTRVSPDEGIKVMASTVCKKNKKGFNECAFIVPQPCPLAQSATATVLILDAHDDVDESGTSSLPNDAVQMRMSRSAALSLCVSMCQSKIRSAASGPVRLTRVSPDEGIEVMASMVCTKNKKGV
ncbi:hypothetical protein MRX96_020429 [Rhipicephalus microplus]